MPKSKEAFGRLAHEKSKEEILTIRISSLLWQVIQLTFLRLYTNVLGRLSKQEWETEISIPVGILVLLVMN